MGNGDERECGREWAEGVFFFLGEGTLMFRGIEW